MYKPGDLSKYASVAGLVAGTAAAVPAFMAGKALVKNRSLPFLNRYPDEVAGRMYNLWHQQHHGRSTGIDDETLGKQIKEEQADDITGLEKNILPTAVGSGAGALAALLVGGGIAHAL